MNVGRRMDHFDSTSRGIDLREPNLPGEPGFEVDHL
jgi:hypothetical protein